MEEVTPTPEYVTDLGVQGRPDDVNYVASEEAPVKGWDSPDTGPGTWPPPGVAV